MAKETKRISPADELIRFADGTELLVAPLTGEATLWSAGETSSRLFDVPADEDVSMEFHHSLKALGISQRQSLHLDLEGFSGQPGYGGHKQCVVFRPPPGKADSTVQVVLFQDESGGLTWHFPDGFFDVAPEKKPERAEFTIFTRSLAAQEVMQKGIPFQATQQSPITKQGRMVFKVLAIPTSGVGDVIAQLEAQQHDYVLRSVSAEDYRQREGKRFAAWDSLAGKRSLLVIHDLFSSVAGMLSVMPTEDVAMLYDNYERRVIGFDHPTVSQSPEQNARFLIEVLNREVPGDTFEFDVLAHGRGGIVARILAEQGEELGGRRLRVRKIFMAGVPNLGTPLANPECLPDLLNVFTNLHANFTEGPALYPLPLLLASVAQLARNPQTVMPGIAAMGVKGYVQEVLNSVKPPRAFDYVSISADFQPDAALDNAFLTSTFKNEVVERVFAVGNTRAQNDLLVPTETFHISPKSHAMRTMLMFKPDEHVCHTAYFGQPKTVEMMKTHFGLRTQTFTALRHSVGDQPFERFVDELVETVAQQEIKVGATDSFEHSQEGLISARISRAIDASRFPRDTNKEDEGLLAGNTEKETEIGKMLREASNSTSERKELSFDLGHIAAVSNEEPSWPSWNQPAAKSAQPTSTRITTGMEAGTTVQRTPIIEVPESVQEGQTIEVKVALKPWSSGGSATGPVNVQMPAASQEVTVIVRLDADGFEFVDGEVAKMIRVQRGTISRDESVTFKLKARSLRGLPVQRRIIADFWQNNAPIGWVGSNIVVNPVTGGGQTALSGKFQLSESDRTSCDLILLINEASELHAMVKNMYLFKPMGQLKFNSNKLAETIQTYISPHINAFQQNGTPDEIRTWKKDFVSKLVTLGGELWTMLPEQFRREYFRLREATNLVSIWVQSEEMVFPWELVRPFPEGGEPELTLGQLHVLGRWLPQLNLLPSPQQMRVEKVVILNPKYEDENIALPWSGEEVNELLTLFQSAATLIKPVNEANVNRFVLESTDVHLLHFTGHGDANEMNSDLNYLMLEDRQLEAARFSQTKLGPGAHPFLMLNACSVGLVNEGVTRPAGFPSTCLRGGFSGLIAPLWPVPDRSAMDFSLQLYRKLLLNKRSIGEALSELRREKPTDPTYLAYTFFGDPWARLLFA